MIQLVAHAGPVRSPITVSSFRRWEVTTVGHGRASGRGRSSMRCLVSERLSMPVIERKTKEVIAASGAKSEERFNRVVLGEGVTFRKQAKI